MGIFVIAQEVLVSTLSYLLLLCGFSIKHFLSYDIFVLSTESGLFNFIMFVQRSTHFPVCSGKRTYSREHGSSLFGILVQVGK